MKLKLTSEAYTLTVTGKKPRHVSRVFNDAMNTVQDIVDRCNSEPDAPPTPRDIIKDVLGVTPIVSESLPPYVARFMSGQFDALRDAIARNVAPDAAPSNRADNITPPPEGYAYYGPGPLTHKKAERDGNPDVIAFDGSEWSKGYGMLIGDTKMPLALLMGSEVAKANGFLVAAKEATTETPEPQLKTRRQQLEQLEKLCDGLSLDEPAAETPVTKTAADWFEDLPDGYRERALSNAEKFPIPGVPSDEHFPSLSLAISGGFLWTVSPEGVDFWLNLNRHLINGGAYSIPALPEEPAQEPAETAPAPYWRYFRVPFYGNREWRVMSDDSKAEIGKSDRDLEAPWNKSGCRLKSFLKGDGTLKPDTEEFFPDEPAAEPLTEAAAVDVASSSPEPASETVAEVVSESEAETSDFPTGEPEDSTVRYVRGGWPMKKLPPLPPAPEGYAWRCAHERDATVPKVSSFYTFGRHWMKNHYFTEYGDVHYIDAVPITDTFPFEGEPEPTPDDVAEQQNEPETVKPAFRYFRDNDGEKFKFAADAKGSDVCIASRWRDDREWLPGSKRTLQQCESDFFDHNTKEIFPDGEPAPESLASWAERNKVTAADEVPLNTEPAPYCSIIAESMLLVIEEPALPDGAPSLPEPPAGHHWKPVGYPRTGDGVESSDYGRRGNFRYLDSNRRWVVTGIFLSTQFHVELVEDETQPIPASEALH